jgi:Sulfotransferase family
MLLESDLEFRHFLDLFYSRMSGTTTFSEHETLLLFKLADHDRLFHPKEWLHDRASSFCNGHTSKRPDQPWAWKEPNSHIVIDRIFRLDPRLKYIHVVRHPVAMATSSNQSQLANWGPIIFDTDVAGITPRASLSFWCAAHRRITDFIERWPTRTMVADHDALCGDPNTHCSLIADFVGAELNDDIISAFNTFVRRSDDPKRSNNGDLSIFDSRDLAYVESIGYSL